MKISKCFIFFNKKYVKLFKSPFLTLYWVFIGDNHYYYLCFLNYGNNNWLYKIII
ncbi:MAG: hypothetical protein BWY04_00177 [candidate division CPR1 bacterium ADurb.Bin160]|uniref:Uncharacterized protein n=1 Tax=candidate division CPR1 bacterium ADurb.Bin160 TaxID=1852826 RepID=A0A1V5ZQL9_9BACT|nr:MAG: hypothetical protein BWY04_00177 [candidate division CPR1 bacterium ADurb.Bin160]